MENYKEWQDLSREEKGALLLAFHEGKKIQFYGKMTEEWVDTIYTPTWTENSFYRVKPEPPTQDTLHIKFVPRPEYSKMPCAIRKFDTRHSFYGSTEYIRAEKAGQHVGIRAKALEFEKFSDGEYVARAFGYDYWIIGKDGIIWQLGVRCAEIDFYVLECKTLEAAKVAANKHFRVQLAEWLEDVT